MRVFCSCRLLCCCHCCCFRARIHSATIQIAQEKTFFCLFLLFFVVVLGVILQVMGEYWTTIHSILFEIRFFYFSHIPFLFEIIGASICIHSDCDFDAELRNVRKMAKRFIVKLSNPNGALSRWNAGSGVRWSERVSSFKKANKIIYY